MPTSIEELDSFHQFVSEKLNNGGTQSSLEDLLAVWRSEQEYASTVDDIRQGIADHEAGFRQPLADAFADIRRDLGLSK